MRTIAVVSTSRADYGILRPVLQRIEGDPELILRLIITGSHILPAFGYTKSEILEDGFEITHEVEMVLESDTPEAVGVSMGEATAGFSRALAMVRPDILLVLGDRYEMHAAAVAALPATIPVAHIHGGEVTEGAIDESLRHSITKLSHLHFVANNIYARRVLQLGEEKWRITVSGSPTLDSVLGHNPLPLEELEALVGMSLPERGFLIATFHPETVEWESVTNQVAEVIRGLDQADLPVLFTYPNADTGGMVLRKIIIEAIEQRPSWRGVENLGTRAYFTILSRAAAMVGNSSSGLIEAPSFGLPAVNVGSRQDGRVRGPNVIDVPCEAGAIAEAIRVARQPEFRSFIEGVRNPYGDGHASDLIVRRLKEVPLNKELVTKRFLDVDVGF